MDGSRFSLWGITRRTFKVFIKEGTMNRRRAEQLVKNAFLAIPYSENAFIKVRGDISPFGGDIIYWSQRQSKLYDGITARKLKQQKHTCEYCGMKFLPGEDIHLHHIDGNHSNWKDKNLVVLHHSCHQYHHMMLPLKNLDDQERSAGKPARYVPKERCGG